jgi:hypothetical protein
MPIHLYFADPYSPLRFEDYLHSVRTIADWIVFVPEIWPHEDEADPYFDGIAISNLGEQAAYHLAKWSKQNLKTPALVFIDKPISGIHSTVPPTGSTHSEAPLVSFATLTFGGEPIPPDVINLTVLHELLHMAHNLENPSNDGLVNTHCVSERCVLNAKRDGHFEGDVLNSVAFIRARGKEPCSRCCVILDKVRRSGKWS